MPREERPTRPVRRCSINLIQGDALETAGFNFVVIAKALIERLRAFAQERGWQHMRLLSSAHNTFNHDYHAEFEDGQQADDNLVSPRIRHHPPFLELV
jgi:predicted dithiol-disulfide oxidoreductase (DUF899 family)